MLRCCASFFKSFNTSERRFSNPAEWLYNPDNPVSFRRFLEYRMPSLQDPAPGFEDVWRTIQELALSHRETERIMKEGARETERRFQETERFMKKNAQETERRFQETERFIKEAAQETERMFQETERRFQETERRFQETEQMIKTVNRQLGALGNRLGEFVQEMVFPAVVRLFKERGLPVHHVSRNVASFDDTGRFVSEIDLLVVNSGTAIAVECKSRLSQDDVDEHLERLAQFKQDFPAYDGCRLLGAVAAMALPHDLARYAYRKGLFVLSQSGDSITIRNDAAFIPREW